MRFLLVLVLFFSGSSVANPIEEDDHSLICTYQSAISTHIAHELLKGVSYQDAAIASFSLFERQSTKEYLDGLELALGTQFDNEGLDQFGKTLGLAGIMWAYGFRKGWVVGSYDQLYDASYNTCLIESKKIGLTRYFDAYHMSIMQTLEEQDKDRSRT